MKHEHHGSENTNFVTPELASPKEKVKENINKTIYIPEYIDKELWNDFLEMRKKIKKPPTDRAKELLIKDLIKFNDDGEDVNEILRKSIKGCWQGLFSLKDDRKQMVVKKSKFGDGW